MATVAELNAMLVANQQALDAMQQRVTDIYNGVVAQNAALQAAYDDLLANPNVPNESLAQLQATIDDANAFAQSIAPPSS